MVKTSRTPNGKDTDALSLHSNEHGIHDRGGFEYPNRIPAPANIHRVGHGPWRSGKSRELFRTARKKLFEKSFSYSVALEVASDVKLYNCEFRDIKNFLTRRSAICPPLPRGEWIAETEPNQSAT